MLLPIQNLRFSKCDLKISTNSGVSDPGAEFFYYGNTVSPAEVDSRNSMYFGMYLDKGRVYSDISIDCVHKLFEIILNILKNKKEFRFRVDNFFQFDNIGMMELFQYGYFSNCCAWYPLLLTRQSYFFEGNELVLPRLLVLLGVFGLVDNSEGALPQFFNFMEPAPFVSLHWNYILRI